MLFDRSLVLAAEETLRFVVCDDRSVVLTADGRELGELAAGDAVSCTRRPASGPHRHVRPPRLPPDPEGQVRPRRPVGTADARRAARRRSRDRRRPRPRARRRPGLTAITGETGAGKTLIVEAVELLVGGRADAALVRDGADEARVEGRFVDPGDRRRDRARARAARATVAAAPYVDGRLATAGELAEVGRALVDLHGQHAHQSLLDPAVQRGALDRYAGRGRARRAGRATATHAPRCATLDDELAALGGDARARAREIDLLRFQVEEIAAAGLDDPAEDVALEAEELLLADAVAHRDALGRRVRGARRSRVSTRSAGALAALDGRAPFAELAARPRRCRASSPTSSRSCATRPSGSTTIPSGSRRCAPAVTSSTSSAASTATTLADVIAYGAESAARLAELEALRGAGGRRSRPRRAEHEAAAAAAAAELSRGAPGGRRAARPGDRGAPPRAGACPTRWWTCWSSRASPPTTGTTGSSSSWRPTRARRPGPLARAASGGELSRAMLATRVVLSEAPPTLVFDEVDAGIGGEAGVAVGRLLQTLGSRHQVLCVTHLAQVAAFAGTQVVVEKTVELERPGRASERTVASAARRRR